jgi:hypothetical protein
VQITGDKKTPAEAQTFLAESAAKHGVECIYQTPDDQIKWLERFPELAEEIPWNSIQRRNIAILTVSQQPSHNASASFPKHPPHLPCHVMRAYMSLIAANASFL